MTQRGDAVLAVLEALEQAVEQARTMPMSSSVLVSKAELLELVSRLRAALPAELADADEVLAGADAVVTAAREEGERVVASARRRADELVSQESVVAAAQVRAAQIVADAERTAAGIRRDADDWCDRRLAEFEIDLGRGVAQVQAGRAQLAERLAPPE